MKFPANRVPGGDMLTLQIVSRNSRNWGVKKMIFHVSPRQLRRHCRGLGTPVLWLMRENVNNSRHSRESAGLSGEVIAHGRRWLTRAVSRAHFAAVGTQGKVNVFRHSRETGCEKTLGTTVV